MKTDLFFKSIFPLFLVFLFSCSGGGTVSEGQLENGDLVFVEAEREELSGAINRVTQTAGTERFDHVGIVEAAPGGIFVLHASAKLGSCRQTLEEFCRQNGAKSKKTVVYRLKRGYRHAIDPAMARAQAMLGKPYNRTYVLDEDSYYCSDFIERAFRRDSVFGHIPMNFKNPDTGQIDGFWADFYQKLGLDVPQDLPGTNPNQLAASEKLSRVGIFQWRGRF